MNKDAVWSPAGFWIRGLAWFIDAFLINLVMSPAATQYPGYFEEHGFRVSGIYLLIWGLYGAVCNLWFQGTLGKKVLNLKVVSAENGGPVSFLVMLFRDGIGRFISLLPMGLGFVWAAFNSEKKSLHDHIFATRVVRKVPVAAYGENGNRG